jgi:hypothetical protein
MDANSSYERVCMSTTQMSLVLGSENRLWCLTYEVGSSEMFDINRQIMIRIVRIIP